jgi:hypothetical protein
VPTSIIDARRYVRVLRHPVSALVSSMLTDHGSAAHGCMQAYPALVGTPFGQLHFHFPGVRVWLGACSRARARARALHPRVHAEATLLGLYGVLGDCQLNPPPDRRVQARPRAWQHARAGLGSTVASALARRRPSRLPARPPAAANAPCCCALLLPARLPPAGPPAGNASRCRAFLLLQPGDQVVMTRPGAYGRFYPGLDRPVEVDPGAGWDPAAYRQHAVDALPLGALRCAARSCVAGALSAALGDRSPAAAICCAHAGAHGPASCGRESAASGDTPAGCDGSSQYCTMPVEWLEDGFRAPPLPPALAVASRAKRRRRGGLYLLPMEVCRRKLPAGARMCAVPPPRAHARAHARPHTGWPGWQRRA